MGHDCDENDGKMVAAVEGGDYSPVTFNCSWYLYIASHSNKLHFNIIPPKYIFCGTRHRNYAQFLRLRNQAPPRKGFGVRFSVRPLPEPEPDPLNPNRGFSSGFGESAEPNQ